jgi:hypothetical protein
MPMSLAGEQHVTLVIRARGRDALAPTKSLRDETSPPLSALPCPAEVGAEFHSFGDPTMGHEFIAKQIAGHTMLVRIASSGAT